MKKTYYITNVGILENRSFNWCLDKYNILITIYAYKIYDIYYMML